MVEMKPKDHDDGRHHEHEEMTSCRWRGVAME